MTKRGRVGCIAVGGIFYFLAPFAYRVGWEFGFFR